MAQSTWNHCPDQKGIKTLRCYRSISPLYLESLP